MVNKSWILFDIILNLILFILIAALSLLLLSKIKLKLNLATKSVYYLNLTALALRILFTFWQFIRQDFETTAGKQYFLFSCEAVIFVFYLNNVSRVIASWMLINRQSTKAILNEGTAARDISDDLIADVTSVNRHIQFSVTLFFMITVPLTVLNCTIFTSKSHSHHTSKWLVYSLAGFTVLFYLF